MPDWDSSTWSQSVNLIVGAITNPYIITILRKHNNLAWILGQMFALLLVLVPRRQKRGKITKNLVLIDALALHSWHFCNSSQFWHFPFFDGLFRKWVPSYSWYTKIYALFHGSFNFLAKNWNLCPQMTSSKRLILAGHSQFPHQLAHRCSSRANAWRRAICPKLDMSFRHIV